MGLPQLVFFGTDLVTFGVSFVNFYALYFAISVTLNLEFGYAGIPNFGKVLFVAGGAAFAGSFAGQFAAWVLNINTHGDFIVFNPSITTATDADLIHDPLLAVGLVVMGVAVGAAIGALLGYLSSYPAIRLREDYLGMLLLGAAQFFQVILQTYKPLVGGVDYIQVPDPYIWWSSLGPGYRDLIAGVVVSGFAILVYVYAERVARSPLGRVLRAVRDNEDASRALGKDDAAFRRNILIAASAIAGVAGALYTFYVASVEYDTWSRFAWTFWPFLIVIIGGAGNNVGAAFGAFFFALVFKGLQQIQPYVQPYIFFNVNWLQDLLFAGLLIVILLLRPEGILPEKPTPTLSSKKLKGLVAKLESGTGSHEQPSKLGGAIRGLTRRIRRLVWKEKDSPPNSP